MTTLANCGDEHNQLNSITPAKGARVKFIHAAADATDDAKAVNINVNGAKVSANTTGGALAYFSTFPVTDYIALAPGNADIDVLSVVNNVESPFLEATLNIEDEKYYSVAVIGNKTLGYETFVMNDGNVAKIPNDNKARFRFINLIHNSTNNLDLITTTVPSGSGLTPGNLITNVAYKGGEQAFSEFPLGTTSTGTAAVSGTFSIRVVDANTKATVASATNISFTANKVYTIIARGQIGGATPTGPALTVTTNR
jgi:Domain of unknown function (DUF4397)